MEVEQQQGVVDSHPRSVKGSMTAPIFNDAVAPGKLLAALDVSDHVTHDSIDVTDFMHGIIVQFSSSSAGQPPSLHGGETAQPFPHHVQPSQRQEPRYAVSIQFHPELPNAVSILNIVNLPISAMPARLGANPFLACSHSHQWYANTLAMVLDVGHVAAGKFGIVEVGARLLAMANAPAVIVDVVALVLDEPLDRALCSDGLDGSCVVEAGHIARGAIGEDDVMCAAVRECSAHGWVRVCISCSSADGWLAVGAGEACVGQEQKVPGPRIKRLRAASNVCVTASLRRSVGTWEGCGSYSHSCDDDAVLCWKYSHPDALDSAQ